MTGSKAFEATLGARNGVPTRHYQFKVVKARRNSGSFRDEMISGCKRLGAGFKPVCDHPSYCKNDARSIYIGQNHHIAYPGHRNHNGYFPSGLFVCFFFCFFFDKFC